MRRVLVTGASGFVGLPLCRRLLEQGVEVHAVSRRGGAPDGATPWRADLADAREAERVLAASGADTVFHLAGHVSGSRELGAVLPSLAGNLLGAVHVLVAAARHGCRLVVLAGSMEEPDADAGERVPSSPYAAAKAGATSYGRLFRALYGLPVVPVRLFMVYGPGQRDRTKLVPYVVTSLLRGEAPELSSGRREVDWVYVDDAVEGLLAAARDPAVAEEGVDVGSGTLVSVRALVEELAACVGGDVAPVFGALPDRPLERARAADVERTRALTGWEPRTPLAEGVRRTVEWYRQELARETATAGARP